MAAGIVEVLARSGRHVVAVTRGEEKTVRMRDALTVSMTKGVVRGKITEADRTKRWHG
jgi:3-hydroxybutyryl-CoA dehydrogenase